MLAALDGGVGIRLAYAHRLRVPDVLAPATLAHLAPSARAAFVPPWPSVAIAAGRRPAAALRWLKRQAGADMLAVYLMRPGRLRGFDLVAIPAHDGDIRDGRVMTTLGAPHPFDRHALDLAAAGLPAAAARLPRPYVTVLIGGPTRRVRFGRFELQRLADDVSRLAGELGGSVLATTSPRTPKGLAAELAALLTVPSFVHDVASTEANPLRALLGVADRIVVTGDSASMLSEACAAARPVHVFSLPNSPRKFQRLECALAERGFVQPWNAPAALPRTTLDEASRVAAAIRERLSSVAVSGDKGRCGRGVAPRD